jgi:hypothetical protein
MAIPIGVSAISSNDVSFPLKSYAQLLSIERIDNLAHDIDPLNAPGFISA